MPTTIRQGRVAYRSRVLPVQRALSFANAILNNSRFERVELHPAGESHYRVCYHPRPEREAAILAAQEAAREQRAEEQAPEWGFEDLPGGRVRVTNPKTGGRYIVERDGRCDCPDRQYRALACCKHSSAVAARAVKPKAESLAAGAEFLAWVRREMGEAA